MRWLLSTAALTTALMLQGCWLTPPPEDASYQAPAQGANPNAPGADKPTSIDAWDGQADLNVSKTWDFAPADTSETGT